jgi:hypothetical protein
MSCSVWSAGWRRPPGRAFVLPRFLLSDDAQLEKGGDLQPVRNSHHSQRNQRIAAKIEFLAVRIEAPPSLG